MNCSRSSYIHFISPGVKFGVELKEVYPPWYLHPTLKNLIYLAETNIRSRHGARFDIEQLFGKGCNGEGSVKQRLELKRRVMHGKDILDIDLAPGIPLWLIRHFLGLLPTPVFPPKCDEHYWYNFSVRNYEAFIESIRKGLADKDLLVSVSSELAQLPARNLTLIFELFEMIRFLSMNSLEDGIVDKRAALFLVKYFTPSLIERPYRPGNFTKNDKKYFAFILFSVHFWPELRTQIHENIISEIKNPEKLHYHPKIYNKYASYWNNDIYLKDTGTQTENGSVSELFLPIQPSSAESSNENYNTRRRKEILCDNLKPTIAEKNSNVFQNNLKKFETPDIKIISSTPDEKRMKDQDMLSRNKNSQIVDKTDCAEKSCKFIKNISTSTNNQNEAVFSLSTKNYPKFGVKKKLSKRKIDNDIVLLQIPCGRNRLKNIKIVTYRKYKQKLIRINENVNKQKQEPSKGNISSTGADKIDGISRNTPNRSTENCDIVKYGWKIDSTTNDDDGLMYDSYFGDPHDQTQTPLRPKQLFSTCKLRSTSKDISSSSFQKKVTQYGWIYNSKMSSSTDPYKLYYDNEQKSSASVNSETPLTEKIKRKKSSLMRFSTKLLFFKKFTSQGSKKSVSCNDLNCTVKYEKFSKSANSI